MIFKCKICGGDLNIERGQSIVECEYCGVKQTLPRFLDENTKLMYDRANSYLMHNEFDKAENIYNQILFADREDADAYWSLVLCKYGISYVKDPKTQKYIPTCNRTYYSSIFDDENYKNAIKYANAEKAELFKTDAKTIDDIQRGIVAISRKEKPFDIFISYKETGVSGGRTKDSIAAQELYEKLTAEGYKVFFSRITLEDKIGTEYEPYIYAALASSKVMITVCSSKENIESVWVKNEWSRFMSFMQKDSAKTILPLYFDMDKSDLPDEFAHLPSFNMKSQGFEQDLIRGIKKIIPMPIEEYARRKKRNRLLGRIGMVAVAAIIIGCIFAIPTFKKSLAYNDANELYNSKHYAESAWAFQELGSFSDSKSKATKAEISWRKSVADIAADAFATAKSAGFECINCEATRYGAYIEPNGNIQEFYSKMTDTTDDVDAVHGKVCDIIGLYDDGCLMGSLSLGKDKREIADDVIQAFRTCEGYIYLKTDGTVGAMRNADDIVTNGMRSVGETNKGKYTNWAETTQNWNGIAKLVYYNDFDFSPKNVSEILIGIKADGTMLVGGNIVNIDINKIDFSNVNNAVDADIAIGYYSTKVDYSKDYPIPSNVMIAVIRNDGKAEYYNVNAESNSLCRTIGLNAKIIDCSFCVEDYTLKLLCSDGYVYKCDLEDMSTQKMNIGGGNVYMEAYMAVNKNGEPRFFESGDSRCLPSSFKTRVYDELLERID